MIYYVIAIIDVFSFFSPFLLFLDWIRSSQFTTVRGRMRSEKKYSWKNWFMTIIYFALLLFLPKAFFHNFFVLNFSNEFHAKVNSWCANKFSRYFQYCRWQKSLTIFFHHGEFYKWVSLFFIKCISLLMNMPMLLQYLCLK